MVDLTRNRNFFACVQNGHLKKVKELLHNGHDVNELNEHGTSALTYAIYYKQLAIIELLLQVGFNVRCKEGQSHGTDAKKYFDYNNDRCHSSSLVKTLLQNALK